MPCLLHCNVVSGWTKAFVIYFLGLLKIAGAIEAYIVKRTPMIPTTASLLLAALAALVFQLVHLCLKLD